MDKLSRKQLIERIEIQDAENTKYRTRFRDLVIAYKGLQTEKAALETSLKALSTGVSRNDVWQGASDPLNVSEDGTGITSHFSDQTDSGPTRVDTDGKSGEVSLDDGRIDALSKALVTLTEEKTRTENNLLADKRKLKQELDDLRAELQEKLKTFEKQRTSLQKTVNELQNDIYKEKQQRQEDQTQQNLMMRELQAKLIAERANGEKFEQQYKALLQQTAWKTQANSQQRTIEEYEKMLEDLSKEMAKLKKMHQEAMDKAHRPNPMLLKLQSEMKDIKVKHQEAVDDEQRQSCHAKAELRSLALSSESRISSLEAKVAELSQMIGNYDRLRTQDQNSIQKLKERIAQLDLEKNLLLQEQKSGSGRITTSDKELQEDSNLDVHSLAEKITKLKDLLYLANQRSEKPLDTHVLLRLQESPIYDSDIHSRCKEELEQLKDEFEHYKNRAQNVLKSKAAKDQTNHGELEILRRQVSELKGLLHASRLQCDQQVKASEERLQLTHHEHRQQMRQLRSQLELDHSSKILEMEQQIQRQRERTVVLLEEKDKDLAHKDRQLASLTTGLTFPTTQIKSQGDLQLSMVRQISQTNHSETEDDVTTTAKASIQENLPEMLSQAMTSSSGDHLILHYVQDIARKDLEISNLRKSRHQAETSLRELQRDFQSSQAQNKDEIETLQAKIYRLESCQSREGVNMEYLKNVVLRYTLCKDVEGKRRILNAIAAVLHFTVRELELARLGL